MPDSVAEQLRQDMQCESLLECFHGLTELDREVFRTVVESEQPLTVDEIGAAVDRERSTAYRSVQRLLEAELLQKEQLNYEDGGYYHVYRERPPEEIVADMQRLLNDWYAQMGQLIREFEKKYEGTADSIPSVGN